MTKRRHRFRRGTTIATLVVVLLVVLWGGYWYLSNRMATGAVQDLLASLAADGRAVACVENETGGFPLSLDLDCGQPTFNDTKAGMAVGFTRLTASAPVYWPGSVTAALSAPMAIDAPAQGLAYDANWSRAIANADAGLSGLNSIAFELDELTVAAKPDVKKPPFTRLAASRARGAAEPAGGDAYRFTLLADDLLVKLRKGADLPAFAIQMDVTAHDVGGSLGTDPAATMRAWLASGGTVDVTSLLVALGGSVIRASGAVRLSPAGLITGNLTIRVSGLKKLPKAVAKIRPGAEDQVKQWIAAASMFAKPVEGDADAREMPIAIRDSVVTVGVIAVATIPPLRF
ncbi:DUF2125 domain-containing protein [Bauldia litoralis]|uniref:DUF2125 domain-containing protein n=1 Tax=Bauldia litoralis TaxID=665467 RepID=UPI0032677BDA